ncbi:hypothetical protein VQ643_01230 [Pseudomonas sp. F1_0610]|uniref:hypothetical protein n=1 Tax=Pseudomonas sp. F1_0610 TaxID=3114284 RepID=UPI0039C2D31D
MTLEELFNNFQLLSEKIPDHLRLRIHRCLSWLKKADQSEADLDIRFISLWIAFNAAYAKDKLNITSPSERLSFRDFISLVNRKAHQEINLLVWNKYSGSIRLLLNNEYIFQPFWNFKNNLISEQEWLDAFQESKRKANIYLSNHDLESVLAVIFERLYTLRNQIFHGGSTYNSSANREQLKDACNFLTDCLYVFVGVMLKTPESKEWGLPFYPYISA